MVQTPRPNAGHAEKTSENLFFSRKKSKLPKKIYMFLHISFIYDKILGETNFRTLEIPRSGSKAKDGEKREKRERKTERW